MVDGKQIHARILNEKFENSYKFKYSKTDFVLELRIQ